MPPIVTRTVVAADEAASAASASSETACFVDVFVAVVMQPVCAVPRLTAHPTGVIPVGFDLCDQLVVDLECLDRAGPTLEATRLTKGTAKPNFSGVVVERRNRTATLRLRAPAPPR